MYKDCQKRIYVLCYVLMEQPFKCTQTQAHTQRGARTPPFQGLTQISKSHANVFQLIEQQACITNYASDQGGVIVNNQVCITDSTCTNAADTEQ